MLEHAPRRTVERESRQTLGLVDQMARLRVEIDDACAGAPYLCLLMALVDKTRGTVATASEEKRR